MSNQKVIEGIANLKNLASENLQGALKLEFDATLSKLENKMKHIMGVLDEGASSPSGSVDRGPVTKMFGQDIKAEAKVIEDPTDLDTTPTREQIKAAQNRANEIREMFRNDTLKDVDILREGDDMSFRILMKQLDIPVTDKEPAVITETEVAQIRAAIPPAVTEGSDIGTGEATGDNAETGNSDSTTTNVETTPTPEGGEGVGGKELTVQDFLAEINSLKAGQLIEKYPFAVIAEAMKMNGYNVAEGKTEFAPVEVGNLKKTINDSQG